MQEKKAGLVPKRSSLFFLLLAALAYFALPYSHEIKSLSAVFLFAVLFWAFEPIPIFATSLWAVLFLALSFSDPSLFYSGFSNPLIFLFFGGLVLAAALNKHRINEHLLLKILTLVGSHPYKLLASSLFMSAFFSMWISNTACAAMMLALYQPIVKQLPLNEPLRKSIPLSIAFGANIGGMATPIGTPPNAIALGIIRSYGASVSFLDWMEMALPLALGILLFSFLLLARLFPPQLSVLSLPLAKAQPLTSSAKKTAALAAILILLWLTSGWHHLPESWIALAGVGVLASLGLIDTHDLKQIDWDILILMWGGLALGFAIEKSQFISLLSFGSLNEFSLIALFSLGALLLSTFISNTAAANLLLPVAIAIASIDTMLIAIPVALCCSLAMSLPISTPPNAMAYNTGSVTTREMFKAGALIGAFSLILILVGFKWAIPRAFAP